MSKKFKKVKDYYDNGFWSIARVHEAVEHGWITAEEYTEITGYDFDDGDDGKEA